MSVQNILNTMQIQKIHLPFLTPKKTKKNIKKLNHLDIFIDMPSLLNVLLYFHVITLFAFTLVISAFFYYSGPYKCSSFKVWNNWQVLRSIQINYASSRRTSSNFDGGLHCRRTSSNCDRGVVLQAHII